MRRAWTRDLVIEAARDWVRRYGDTPTKMSWDPAEAKRHGRGDLADRFATDGCWPYVSTVHTYFGGWNEMIRAAGYPPRKVGRRRPNSSPMTLIDQFGKPMIW